MKSLDNTFSSLNLEMFWKSRFQLWYFFFRAYLKVIHIVIYKTKEGTTLPIKSCESQDLNFM